MMAVFLTILKIIGIVIGIIVALALLIVAAVLFVPVRYKVIAEGNMPDYNADIIFYWLLHIVSLRLTFDKIGTLRKIKVFGIPVSKSYKEKETKEEESDIVDKIVDILLKITGKDGEDNDSED